MVFQTVFLVEHYGFIETFGWFCKTLTWMPQVLRLIRNKTKNNYDLQPRLFKKKMYIWIYKIYVTNKMPLLPVVYMTSSSFYLERVLLLKVNGITIPRKQSFYARRCSFKDTHYNTAYSRIQQTMAPRLNWPLLVFVNKVLLEHSHTPS